MAKSTYVAEQILRVRLAQMMLNERYKKGEFKVPIHLAMGHEAIAVAVSEVMTDEDRLVLPHRNLHYNLARAKSFRPILNEFLLQSSGMAGARLGSMNLSNDRVGILYSSSILGNAMGVAAGVGLGLRVNESPGVVIVVTGDGALEEGAFTESLTFMRTYAVSALVLVENNGWSMSTCIAERRCDIHLEHVAAAYGVDYHRMEGNDPYSYIAQLESMRRDAVAHRRPAIVEVQLHTLGDWRTPSDAHPEGRLINYHAGPANTVALASWPPIRGDRDDPVFALLDHFDEASLERLAGEQMALLQAEAE